MQDKMTVKEFLEKGYKFVDGDVLLSENTGLSVTLGGVGTTSANSPHDNVYSYFVTSAKALEQEDNEQQTDNVKNPSHYQLIEGYESIRIIASSLTLEAWKGFCLGNIIKYRLRAGNKDALEQDIAKADFYKELYEKYKYLCK